MDIPGGPVVKTLFSNAGGAGLIPWSRSQDPTYLIAKKPKHGSNVVTNSIKTLKMVHIETKQSLKKKTTTEYLKYSLKHISKA